MVVIDWTISIGNMLTVITLIGALVLGYMKLMARVDNLERDYTGMEKAMAQMAGSCAQMGTLMSDSTIIQHRIERIEQDVREIRHGEGFVFPLGTYRPPDPGE